MNILKKLLLALVLAICVGSVVRAAMLYRPQSPSSPLTFEVASIKPYAPGATPAPGIGGFCHGLDTAGATSSVPLGRCVYSHITLRQLMLQAFPPTERLVTADNLTSGNGADFPDVSARGRIMDQDQWVIGGPSWLGSDKFEIEAKAEDPSTTSQDQLRQMLQALVKERFKLAFHMEPKALTGYFIVAAKGGLKLKEVPPRSSPTPAEMAKKRESGIQPFPVQHGTLTQLAIMMTLRMKMPVINTINVPQWYDFTGLDGVALGDPSAASDGAAGSILTEMQDRLGLKLEPGKVPVQIFVIDHAEKPSEQ